MDAAGDLYGTFSNGGTYNEGTVYELPEGSSTITTLFSFNGLDGADPQAALIMDSAGNLYGTTLEGGLYGGGTVFELTRGVTNFEAETADQRRREPSSCLRKGASLQAAPWSCASR